jgi:DNA-binding CsgD family transcriptional regulator
MLYGIECWTVKKQHIHKMSAAEMKMLRWISENNMGKTSFEIKKFA